MKILMMTNTYKPIMGGLERSIELFTKEFRKKGHDVLIVAPEYENAPEEQGVIRIPAIQNFNGSDFSVQIPIHPGIIERINSFGPDIIHSHHPFLMGATALRVSAIQNVPLVYTFHTLFEQYTAYLPKNKEALRRFVVSLSSGFANLCDCVIAPSRSIADILKERKVTVPIEIIPTGIEIGKFGIINRKKFRTEMNIPEEAFVIGYAGRIEEVKNLKFLANAVAVFLKKEKKAHFILVGKGDMEDELKNYFKHESLDKRVHFCGAFSGQDLADAYGAMDIFAFSSKSETQAIVLAEAMISKLPVIALDGPGVRDIVDDNRNGRLLHKDDPHEFAKLLSWFLHLPELEKKYMQDRAHRKALEFSLENCADNALNLYTNTIRKGARYKAPDENLWNSAMNRIRAEWDLLSNMAKAAGSALSE